MRRPCANADTQDPPHHGDGPSRLTGSVPAMPAHTVRRARPHDVGPLAATLARAFDDDPLTTWLFPDDERRRRRLPGFFRSLLRASLPFGEVYAGDDRRCAAIWNPPGTFPMGWSTDARLGLTTARLVGLRIGTCARGLLYFASHHPKERHWYLQMLGTDPEQQGRGAGSAIMAPVLERCDREDERVYLESTKERNIPFYARHGFEVTEELRVPHGPVVWAMWRDPR
jgi:ribosomal protein S18 acetylase RimI-like enzyme